jgi:hypothetical protein
MSIKRTVSSTAARRRLPVRTVNYINTRSGGKKGYYERIDKPVMCECPQEKRPFSLANLMCGKKKFPLFPHFKNMQHTHPSRLRTEGQGQGV